MRFSVIIPTFNRAEYLRAAIDSVLRQRLPAHQVIVVDDGSTDDTPEACRCYTGRILYLRQSNRGKSAALNTGLAKVTGEAVYVLDDDDVALPLALTRHARALASNPKAGFSYGPLLHGRVAADGQVIIDPTHRMATYAPDEFFWRQILANNVVQPCLAIRTECFHKIGTFDERFVRSQDYEFSLRLARHYRGVRLGEPIFVQRQHEGQRGTVNIPIRGKQAIHQAAHTYDLEAQRKILSSLDLSELTTPSDVRDSKSATALRRLQHLRRGVLAAQAQLYSLAIDDFVHGFSSSEEDLTVGESEIIFCLFSSQRVNTALLRPNRFLLRLPWEFCGRAGRNAGKLCTRALYWRMRQAMKRGELVTAFRSFLVACYVWTVTRI